MTSLISKRLLSSLDGVALATRSSWAKARVGSPAGRARAVRAAKAVSMDFISFLPRTPVLRRLAIKIRLRP